ncbi:MAG: nucleotidyltransferase domain-containing protein [Victivallaceae bacterium]|jgi:hypothetical protein
MNKTILNKIAKLKKKYEPRGFIVLGFFGSYARGEETPESDIDILYEMTDKFYQKHPGWNVFPVLDEIEKDFAKSLGRNVDMANKNALNEIGRKYILPEVKYV